jgi:hypothetical protein
MAIPIHAQPRYGGRDFDHAPLPSISSRDEGFGRPFSGRIPFNDNLSPSAASNPMAIRGSDNNTAPPPLPPPPLVPIEGPVDPNIQHHKERRRDFNASLGDSLGLSFERRDLSFKRGFDEGYQSFDSVRLVTVFRDGVGTCVLAVWSNSVFTGHPASPLPLAPVRWGISYNKTTSPLTSPCLTN